MEMIPGSNAPCPDDWLKTEFWENKSDFIEEVYYFVKILKCIKYC